MVFISQIFLKIHFSLQNHLSFDNKKVYCIFSFIILKMTINCYIYYQIKIHSSLINLKPIEIN